MSTGVAFYKEQALAAVSSIPWLAQLQNKALQDFCRLGFPNRHDEEWKYTALDSLIEHSFTQQRHTSTAIPSNDLPIRLQLQINNGSLAGLEAVQKQLPPGVLVMPLVEAVTQKASLIQPYLAYVLDSSHGWHALNTAMLHLGVFIYVPAHVQITEPIALCHYQDKAEQAVHLRHVVVMEEKSQLTLVEVFSGQDQCTYLTNSITEIHLAARAQLHHYKLQQEGKQAYHIGHVAVKQSTHSEFNSHSVSLGGKLVRSDVSIDLIQEHAQCMMNGIYAVAEGQHVDHHTVVRHAVADCRSRQDYKGILAGRSRAVFNGKVLVEPGAQHTDAQQNNKNLLLSSQAEVDTKPQLEIYADDVVCSHGATVGQLDAEALFYLATRGIDKSEASRYLIQAFAAENLRQMAEIKLAEYIGRLITEQVG